MLAPQPRISWLRGPKILAIYAKTRMNQNNQHDSVGTLANIRLTPRARQKHRSALFPVTIAER